MLNLLLRIILNLIIVPIEFKGTNLTVQLTFYKFVWLKGRKAKYII